MIRPIVFGLTAFLLILYAEGRSKNERSLEAGVRAEVIVSNSVEGIVDPAVKQHSHESSEEEDGRCHKKSNPHVSCTGGEDCVDQNGKHCHKKNKQLKWWVVLIICVSVVAGVSLLVLISIKLGLCTCCRRAKPSVQIEPTQDKVNNSYDHTPPGTPFTQSKIWTNEKVHPSENPSAPDPPPYVEKVPEYAA